MIFLIPWIRRRYVTPVRSVSGPPVMVTRTSGNIGVFYDERIFKKVTFLAWRFALVVGDAYSPVSGSIPFCNTFDLPRLYRDSTFVSQ